MSDHPERGGNTFEETRRDDTMGVGSFQKEDDIRPIGKQTEDRSDTRDLPISGTEVETSDLTLSVNDLVTTPFPFWYSLHSGVHVLRGPVTPPSLDYPDSHVGTSPLTLPANLSLYEVWDVGLL